MNGIRSQRLNAIRQEDATAGKGHPESVVEFPDALAGCAGFGFDDALGDAAEARGVRLWGVRVDHGKRG